jgi:hypothetical protein
VLTKLPAGANVAERRAVAGVDDAAGDDRGDEPGRGDADLIAYLVSGGDRKHAVFRGK